MDGHNATPFLYPVHDEHMVVELLPKPAAGIFSGLPGQVRFF